MENAEQTECPFPGKVVAMMNRVMFVMAVGLVWSGQIARGADGGRTDGEETSPSTAASRSNDQSLTEPRQTDENAVINGDFSVWESYTGQGVTTTTRGTPPGSLPQGWYGGPGVGATATYDVVEIPPSQTEAPGHPRRHLRVHWTAPPSESWPGETHHAHDFRMTFLEYFDIRDVRRFAGETVVFSFYGRVTSGTLEVVPILWHSYDASTEGIAGVKGQGYELFEAAGRPGEVAVVQGRPDPAAICPLTTDWRRFEKEITLPPVNGRSITAGHYTGVGFDLIKKCAPVVDIADVRVIRKEATPTPDGPEP